MDFTYVTGRTKRCDECGEVMHMTQTASHICAMKTKVAAPKKVVAKTKKKKK